MSDTFKKMLYLSTCLSETAQLMTKYRKQKYPRIYHNYESKEVPGLFYAGTVTHSLDHRKSAGGFVHGYRYTGNVHVALGLSVDVYLLG